MFKVKNEELITGPCHRPPLGLWSPSSVRVSYVCVSLVTGLTPRGLHPMFRPQLTDTRTPLMLYADRTVHCTLYISLYTRWADIFTLAKNCLQIITNHNVMNTNSYFSVFHPHTRGHVKYLWHYGKIMIRGNFVFCSETNRMMLKIISNFLFSNKFLCL